MTETPGTPEEQAEQLLEAQGYQVLPPAPPAAPAPAQTAVGVSVRLWKPKGKEFTDPDFDALFEEIGPTQLVCYELEDEVQDGVEGHALVCTVVK